MTGLGIDRIRAPNFGEKPSRIETMAAQQVRGAAAEQEEPAKRDSVGGNDPLQRGQAGVKFVTDGRQGDAHDRGVDRGHCGPQHGG